LKIHCSIFEFCYVIKGKNFDSTFNILIDMNNEEKEKRKHGKQITDDTKRIVDGTKQNKKRQ
ncbi:hypothetical protein T09_14667, partial [Trichinella sp. T9]